jgi:hypothetical protein
MRCERVIPAEGEVDFRSVSCALKLKLFRRFARQASAALGSSFYPQKLWIKVWVVIVLTVHGQGLLRLCDSC